MNTHCESGLHDEPMQEQETNRKQTTGEKFVKSKKINKSREGTSETGATNVGEVEADATPKREHKVTVHAK